MDLGGIINHTEQLIGGLKDLGHQVELFEFVYADRAKPQRRDGHFTIGPSDIPHHQGKGWNFPSERRIAYKTSAGLSTALTIINEFDLIIWTVPVPSKNKNNLGNNRWPELYHGHNKRQIAFVHDGNLQNGYPHISAILTALNGLACVHYAALGSTEGISNITKSVIVNPQENPLRNYPDWETKNPGFFNMQTFKAWKHAHELVGAIRHLPPLQKNEHREVVGKGIEYQYMTSEEKCKPHYFHEDGVRFWDAALANGMRHHDYMPPDHVAMWLQRSRVLVDPSWSKKYSKLGGHFNRVAVDGMINGCVVVAHRDGMGSELFKPGEHYIDLSGARDLQDYADILYSAWTMSDSSATAFRSRCRQLLGMFDRKVVAQQVIDLSENEKGIPMIPHNMAIKSANILFDHFGVAI